MSPKNGELAGDRARLRFSRFRIFLGCYFFLYAYVVAVGLIPLPDEPPRINFWGVFLVSVGMVIALQCLVSRSRLFHLIVLGYLFIAQAQMGKRIKFLEMMLEPTSVEVVARYSLALLFVVLCSERAFRTFDQPWRTIENAAPPLFKKGFPF